jgi:DNA-binding CsgD family transcriptional regulator/tetratricopeptide (TPR) repeat protein
MSGMTRRSTSARLLGREREVADLLAAVAIGDADRPVVLLEGEAGIGKTRTLAELIRRLAEPNGLEGPPTRVVRGSCLRLAGGELPFAPVLEILDAMRGDAWAPDVEALRSRLAGAGPEGVQSAEARTQRFLEIRDLLVAAAAESRLVVALDDLHWADQSTLDLVLFLARRLRGTRVILLAAYRSDELHRRHPLRPVVAELLRGFVRERVELGPLDREAVLEQIGELRGPSDADVAAAIVERADGNPFYVEELVFIDPGLNELPATVRDVLLTRLGALDPTTVRVLAACAIVAREVEIDVLSEILELAPESVGAAVDSAVDSSILVQADSRATFRFRHALLEEAMHDDLLPSDRVNLHRRVATVLETRAAEGRDAAVPAGELARHLDLGGQRARAIPPYLEAASVAFRALAWAEGVVAFERASELIATEGDDSAAAMMHDLVVPAAHAMNWAGASSRSISLLREWIARTDEQQDASRAVTLWVELTYILNDVGDEAAARDALDAAIQIQQPDETNEGGVALLISRSAGAWVVGRSREALEIAELAMRGAEGLADPSLLFRALVQRAEARISLGDVKGGLADVDGLRRLEEEHGWLDTHGLLGTNIGSALAEMGELDAALRLWQEALAKSRQRGLERSWDPWNLPGLAMYAVLTGRWNDADAPISEARAFQAAGMPTVWNENIAAHLAAGRGDLAAADRALAAAEAHTIDLLGDWDALVGLARAARADAGGDQGRRLEEADAAISRLEGFDSFMTRSSLVVEVASAAADLVATLRPRRDRDRIAHARARARWAAEYAADLDGGLVIPGVVSVPLTRANAALTAAQTARAEGSDDPAVWQQIASAYEAIGLRPRVAYALFRAGAAALGAGDRAAGAANLREAYELATTIGMKVLAGRIESIARASRIDLGVHDNSVAERDAAAAGRDADRWGLSPRELEVLVLVADGRTNGEIGARLFISTKTASVHVTHILDKLGVSSRTEAALLANQAGLLT